MKSSADPGKRGVAPTLSDNSMYREKDLPLSEEKGKISHHGDLRKTTSEIVSVMDDAKKIASAGLLCGLAGICFLALAFMVSPMFSGEFYFYTIIAVILIAICAFMLREMRRR